MDAGMNYSRKEGSDKSLGSEEEWQSGTGKA